MEENKVCNHGNCEKCKGANGKCCGGHKCCGGCHHAFKILGALVLLALAFCLGIFVGGGRGFFNERFGGPRFMMNRIQNSDENTGSVTVKVLPKVNTDTTTPPVQQ